MQWKTNYGQSIFGGFMTDSAKPGVIVDKPMRERVIVTGWYVIRTKCHKNIYLNTRKRLCALVWLQEYKYLVAAVNINMKLSFFLAQDHNREILTINELRDKFNVHNSIQWIKFDSFCVYIEEKTRIVSKMKDVIIDCHLSKLIVSYIPIA